MLPFSMIFRRMARRADMVLTVALGVLLATALLASAPTLVHTVVVLGLQQTLSSADPLTTNLRFTSSIPPDPEKVAMIDARVRTAVDRHLASYAPQVVASLQSPALFPWVDGTLLTDHKVALRYYEDLGSHTALRAGNWAQDPVPAPNRFAVVIGEELADAYSIGVGDEIPLSRKREETTPAVVMEVTGIIGATGDAETPDDYWFGEHGPLQAYTSGRWAAEFNVFVRADHFYSATLALEPRGYLTTAWHVLLDDDRIFVADAAELSATLTALRGAVSSGSPSVGLHTEMLQLLERFEAQTQVVKAPITLLTAEIVLVALYYVTMTAALAVRQRSAEFAVLGSRGASPRQVFGMQAGEAALLTGVALLSGPGLGRLLVRGLGVVGPLSDIAPQAGGAAVSRLPGAWLAAGVAALASMLGLLLPVPGALRRSVVAHQQTQARDTRTPWWQRLYLDVFAMALGLILLWRLQVYGSIVGGTTARPEVDWLLLFSPLALLLGSATMLLRVFPLVLKGLAAVTGLGRGLVAPLALLPAARQPAHVARLVLLLTLAMALGSLSTGLNATLDLSETERAAYATGSDVRITVRGSDAAAAAAAAPGVTAAATVWRDTGSVRLRGSYPRFEILALPPEQMADLATFRDDFAASDMPALLARLTPERAAPQMERFQEAPLPLPGEPGRIGAWLWAPRDLPRDPRLGWLSGASNHDRVEITAKLVTADKTYLTVLLQAERSDGCTSTCWGNQPCAPEQPWAGISGYTCSWVYFSGPVPEMPAEAYPLNLLSLWFRNRTYYVQANRGPQLAPFTEIVLAIDEIGVVDRTTGASALIEDFEGPTSIWSQGTGGGGYSSTGGYSAPARQNLTLRFTNRVHAISLNPHHSMLNRAIPALVSPAFLAATQLKEGETFHAWAASMPEQTFVVAGSVRHFPTMYENQPIEASHSGAVPPPDAGFILVSRDVLLERLNIIERNDINAREVWLALAPDAPVPVSLTTPGVRQVTVREQVRQALKAHPMALGLRSVTFFGYVLTSLLSLVGFGTYFVMTARQRATLYGVLRSMGLSSAQLYLSLALEQVVLVLWGLGLGTGLGLLLNRLVLPGLPVSLGDHPPVPPFIPQDDWLAVGRLYLLLAAAFLATLGATTFVLGRTRLDRALRIGQE